MKKANSDDEVDWEFVEEFRQAVEDLKNGKFIEC